MLQFGIIPVFVYLITNHATDAIKTVVYTVILKFRRRIMSDTQTKLDNFSKTVRASAQIVVRGHSCKRAACSVGIENKNVLCQSCLCVLLKAQKRDITYLIEGFRLGRWYDCTLHRGPNNRQRGQCGTTNPTPVICHFRNCDAGDFTSQKSAVTDIFIFTVLYSLRISGRPTGADRFHART